MLANVLAVLLGLGSVTFYLAAFLYPEVHRRSDLVWSGLGLLYAVDLWFGAEQMTPTVLLGQIVAVALLIGLGWQTLAVRREKTPVYQQTPIVLTPEVVTDWAKSRLNQLRIAPSDTVRLATLKDRPATGSSTERLRQGLNQSSDPRRRPLYDYEFVEDDGFDDDIQESPTSIEDLETDVSEIELSEIEHIDPPFAIAEVIAIQTDKPTPSDSPQSEAPKPAAIEESVTTSVTTDTEVVTEAVTKENDPIEPKATEPDFDLTKAEDADTKAADAKSADKVDWPDTAADDWDDDLETVSGETARDKGTAVRSLQKPSLLAIPAILLGWARDVVRSLTQPKPSKPIIEIPRRDPPPALTRNQVEDKATSQDESSFDDDDDSDWID
ncbi:Ycf66 family protein [cf. Phormidesmis sp. LEGE 11477]|uniref:Ycf66 family protein n=1 Tax=cf. Phormidesmis sp. LEGE 11477 TaxID=1828680 RepID=UPI00187E40BA|nr:Ycf66 family protein [cf. Phormidesmis sp. LEGE 11477]MBE9062490.1 Ycf66 family protein [cf. Phormidesmis sp. LEGE 11477]